MHLEVYILIIPGFGIISTIISASSNKNVFGQDGFLVSITMWAKQLNFYLGTPTCSGIVLKSTFWEDDYIRNLILNVKVEEKNSKQPLRECEYSRITSILLPYYFKYSDHWCIAP